MTITALAAGQFHLPEAGDALSHLKGAVDLDAIARWGQQGIEELMALLRQAVAHTLRCGRKSVERVQTLLSGVLRCDVCVFPAWFVKWTRKIADSLGNELFVQVGLAVGDGVAGAGMLLDALTSSPVVLSDLFGLPTLLSVPIWGIAILFLLFVLLALLARESRADVQVLAETNE